MTLDPQVKQLLAEMAKSAGPPLNEISPQEARQQMVDASAALGEEESIGSVEDRTVPGPNGEVPIRIYKPTGDKPRRVLVYFHGGGWVVGSIDSHDGYCRSLVNAADVIVVSVDYRLAPEHKFPAAAEDAFAATRWVHENASSFGGLPERIAVAGDSAGGNLAAVVPLMARDRGGPPIALQVLIYPITDYDFNTPSYNDCATGYFLTRDSMIWFWEQYLAQEADGINPYVSPLRAENLQGLPPALVITAGYDPLRDEGEAYAQRLQEAGVETKLSRYDGMIHGFVRRTAVLDKARDSLQEIAARLRASQSP